MAKRIVTAFFIALVALFAAPEANSTDAENVENPEARGRQDTCACCGRPLRPETDTHRCTPER